MVATLGSPFECLERGAKRGASGDEPIAALIDCAALGAPIRIGGIANRRRGRRLAKARGTASSGPMDLRMNNSPGSRFEPQP